MSPYNSSPMENPPASSPAIAAKIVGSWGPITDYTLATGVAAISPAARNARIVSESGATDALTQITGLAVGQEVIISAKSGDTITVTDGASLDLQGVNFTMDNVKDAMKLMCTATGVCREITRSSNN